MFYLIDYVDKVPNVHHFLRRAKLISSFFKEIHTKKILFVIWISQLIFKRTQLSTKQQFFMVSFKLDNFN